MKRQQDIHAAARQILQAAAVRCPQHADKLHSIGIRVSSRMTSCGGTASYRKNEVTISLPFFADEANFTNELFEVVTHEAAHLIVGREGRKGQPHGPVFRSVHRSLGGTGKRTHSMALADGFKGRKRTQRTGVQCPCGCGQTMSLGPTQLKRHNSGRQYYIKGHQRKQRFDLMGDIFSSL